jgi:hypothetical protein
MKPMLKREAPGRWRNDRYVEGAELSRIVRLPEEELQQLALRSQLPFSFSSSAGLWIRRDNLDQWRQAANEYRKERP